MEPLKVQENKEQDIANYLVMLASKKGSLKMFDYNRMLCLEH
jgi:hypothetical protein